MIPRTTVIIVLLKKTNKGGVEKKSFPLSTLIELAFVRDLGSYPGGLLKVVKFLDGKVETELGALMQQVERCGITLREKSSLAGFFSAIGLGHPTVSLVDYYRTKAIWDAWMLYSVTQYNLKYGETEVEIEIE
ncbi:hypothetical protein KKC60_04275 [Patescibacteria group bacterium]|nr:hypothetical protein [Patescibacteria group bacterium]